LKQTMGSEARCFCPMEGRRVSLMLLWAFITQESLPEFAKQALWLFFYAEHGEALVIFGSVRSHIST